MSEIQNELPFGVCVICPTFNHASYIEEAMNGFCMQQTNFPFVCCILDDASTDGERVVINSYLGENFVFVNPLVECQMETDDYILAFAQHKSNRNCYFAFYSLKFNHWGKKDRNNYIQIWINNAQYIAVCEGDDYWTHPKKLQSQYDLLEADPLLAMCYTKVYKYYEEEKRMETTPYGGNKESYSDLFNANCIPTLTVMYRSRVQKEYLDTIKPFTRGWKMGDYPLWLYIAYNYKIKFLNIVTGVYRVNISSASQTNDMDRYLAFMKSADDIHDFYFELYGDVVDIEAYKRCHIISISNYCLIKFNDRSKSLYYMRKINNKTIMDYLKILLLSFDIGARLYRYKMIH